MKKIVLYAFLVVLTFSVLFLIADIEESNNSHQRKSQTTENQEITEQKNKVESLPQNSESGQQDPSASEIQTLDSVEGSIECMEKYTTDPKWIEIYKRFEGLGLSGGELAGVDSYQQLPLGSLKSYADSGDKKAMYLYGTEVMWKSIFGFYMNENYRGPLGFTAELKEKIKQHKVNLEEYKKGVNYVYKAAVRGKLIGLMEIASQKNQLIEAMNKDGLSEELMLEEVAKSYSYLLLMRKVYQHDEMLLRILDYDRSLDQNLGRVYKNRQGITDKHKEKIKENLMAKSEPRFQQLKTMWENDRRYHGLEPYPDLFSEQEEEYYLQSKLDCQ